MKKRILVDLAVLLTPPLHVRETMLKCAELDGIEILCQSYLPKPEAVRALKETGLLQLLDEIIFMEGEEALEVSEDTLVISETSEASYPAVSKHLSRSRPRSIHLLV